MCRILFASGTAINIIENADVYSLFKSLSNGGNTDACGFAILYRDGTVYKWKLPIACEDVGLLLEANREKWRELLSDAMYIMAHARKATRGSPLINTNNHPFCSEEWCVIHNGSLTLKRYVSVPKELLSMKESIAETDSAWLLAILEYFKPTDVKDAITTISSIVEGKASIAAFNRNGTAFYTRNEKAEIHVAVMDYGGGFLAVTAYETMAVLRDAAERLGYSVFQAESIEVAEMKAERGKMVVASYPVRSKKEYWGGYYTSYGSGIYYVEEEEKPKNEKRREERFTVVLVDGRVSEILSIGISP